MKKLFLLAALLLAIAGGSATSARAGAAAACIGDGYGHCMHWQDTARPTTIPTWRYLTDTNWVSAINTALANFNGAQSLIHTPVSVAKSGSQSTNCEVPGDGQIASVYTNLICLGAYNTPCGAGGANTWLACASWLIWIDNWGLPTQRNSPHFAETLIRLALPAHFTDGTVYTWGSQTNDRLFVACHEITGHGNGMDHPNATTPDNTSSCLTATMPLTGKVTVLDSTVVGQIVANHNHNDSSKYDSTASDCQDYCGNPARVQLPRKLVRKLALAKGGIPPFAKFSGVFDAQNRAVYFVPRSQVSNWRVFPSAAENPYVSFVTPGESEALTVDPPTSGGSSDLFGIGALALLGFAGIGFIARRRLN